MDTWFGREMDQGCCKGEEALVAEIGKRESNIQENVQGEHFPKSIDWENERG